MVEYGVEEHYIEITHHLDETSWNYEVLDLRKSLGDLAVIAVEENKAS